MATRAVTQAYDDAMRPSGLRATQYGLLLGIRRLAPVSAAALEAAMLADQTTLARALKVLEKEGLIRRASHPDRRMKRIELTPAGRARLARAHRLWRQAQARMVALIGARGWSEMRRRLGILLQAARPGG